jgi:hypothetical protein
MSAQPHTCGYYEHNLTRMGAEFDKLWPKSRSMKLGHVAFFAGASLVGALMPGA